MTIKLAIGQSNFETIREKEAYYVDKTHFLEDLLKTEVTVTLITRPRRFGKSLMLSMTNEFFNICNDKEDTKKLFEGLSIMKRKDLVDKYMAEHPVLHFSFNGVEGVSFNTLIDSILDRMQYWCERNENTFAFDKCKKTNIKIFNDLEQGTDNPKYPDNKKGWKKKISDMQKFLVTMIAMLYDSYGKKVIVLLDEYDVPLAKAALMEGKVQFEDMVLSPYEAMKKFIASLFTPAFKDNKLMERAVITGCLRIAQASIFTGTNHFAWYGVESPEYSDCFGFSPQEVKQILQDAGFPRKMKAFKEWYDGYVFWRSKIYCPWDVLMQIGLLQADRTVDMRSHWSETSENEILREMLRSPNLDIEPQLTALLKGESISATINNIITYDILEGNEDNLWNILYQTGYLTKSSRNETGDEINLAIPNKEVKMLFEDTIARHPQRVAFS